MAYQYQSVWKKITPELITELTDFWVRENALPKGAQPARRAEQVVVVMRDDADGSIVAVSSVIARVVPRLRQVLYYYRTFCAEKHRRNNTSIPIMQATQQALRDYNLGLPKPEAIGIIVEIESAYINQRYPEAFWPATMFSFIGYSPRGLPVRVHYFTDFKLQPPVRIARTQGAAGNRPGARAPARQRRRPN